MEKTVIFVSGLRFSGSTFFHLTLANDPHGMGIGEVRFLFRPLRENHFSPTWRCGCGDPDCDLWARVKRNGEEHVYETLFELNPEVDFIVDSSKSPFWIADQSNRLARQGIAAKQILIWKTPVEYLLSLKKRNDLRFESTTEWPRYHRRYFTMMEAAWRAVNYKQFTQDTADVLRRACQYLGLSYFEGKERFWERQQHVLGGNPSARVHLYSRDSDQYKQTKDNLDRPAEVIAKTEQTHRSVYYEEPPEAEFRDAMEQLRRYEPNLDRIAALLTAYDVANRTVDTAAWSDLRVSWLSVQKGRVRGVLQEREARLRYGRVTGRSLEAVKAQTEIRG